MELHDQTAQIAARSHNSSKSPKGAIRIGYAASGRLTQFIRPESEKGGSLRFRAEKSWKDLCRQLTGLTAPPLVALKGREAKALELPDPVDTVGIHMLRRNDTDRNWNGRDQTPVAVWISSDSSDVYALVPGTETWVPYRDLHALLATGAAYKEAGSDRKATTNFIRRVVDDAGSGDRPVLLQVGTQNLRSMWPELGVGSLTVDTPRLDGRPLGRSFGECRLVTIRSAESNEVPEVYGMVDEELFEDTGGKQFGMPSGLWRLTDTARTFISTAARPDSAKSHASPMSSRIGDRPKKVRDEETGEHRIERISFIPELGKPSFNSDGLHMTAAWLRPGDDPLAWVALTHAHRGFGEAYDATLKLPIALHLAKQATEYAFPESDSEDPTV